MICTLDNAVYLTRVKGKIAYYWVRSARPWTITFDPTEYRFKLAVLRNNYEEILHIIRISTLLGQSIIVYLQQKGLPEVWRRYAYSNLFYTDHRKGIPADQEFRSLVLVHGGRKYRKAAQDAKKLLSPVVVTQCQGFTILFTQVMFRIGLPYYGMSAFVRYQSFLPDLVLTEKQSPWHTSRQRRTGSRKKPPTSLKPQD